MIRGADRDGAANGGRKRCASGFASALGPRVIRSNGCTVPPIC